MKKLIFGALTLTVLGIVSLPAIADEANIQSATQVTTQDGNDNTSFQRTSQSIQTQRRYVNTNVQNNTGNVQDIYQDTMQRGVNNYGRQENTQQIRSNQQMRRGSSNIEVNQ